MVNKWTIFNRIWPEQATCILCGDNGPYGLDLCPGCHDDLPRLEYSCQRCAETLPTPGEPLCGQCLRQPPPMDRTISALRYGPPLTRLLADLKFHQKLLIAQIFGQLLADHLQQLSPDMPEVILPVPLHRQRLRERGYNQALEIARPVARRLKIPLDFTLCQRQRATAPQSNMNAKERQKNIKRAFKLSRPCSYKHVAIIDDVITTGETVRELSTMLKRNGVEKIQVWSVARAITD